MDRNGDPNGVVDQNEFGILSPVFLDATKLR